MTSADALHVPELDLELVRAHAPSRLPRWDPRLWGRLELSETTRPGDRLRKLGLAWGRERAKVAKLVRESVTPESEKASDSSFTGKEEDIEVGLIYFGKRFYSPYLGRWVSPDPLAVHSPGEADLNLYAYVSGQILRAIDPVGLDKVTNQHEIEQALHDQTGGEYGVNHRSTPTPAPAAATPSGDGGGGGAAPTTTDAKMASGGGKGTSGRGKPPSEAGGGDVAGRLLASLTIPLVGEAMDVEVLADPESDAFDLTMASFSLGYSYLTGGLGPNYGALRVGDDLAGSGKLTLYHGTDPTSAASIREGVDLSVGRTDIDFGQGFYLTRAFEQAQRWAGTNGEVLKFELDPNSLGTLRQFEAGDEALETLVDFHRMRVGPSPAHGFDAVEGPLLLNPRQVYRDLATPSWGGHQLSIHTETGLRALKLIGSGP